MSTENLYRRALRDQGVQTTSVRSIQNEASRLRVHQRYLVHTNGTARTARARHVSNLVGNGIKVRWESQAMQQLWDTWTLHCNANGFGNFGTTQYHAVMAGFDGEAFVRQLVLDAPGDIPLRLQTLEADYLDLTHSNGTDIYAGIQFDGYGRPLNYHFWQTHPSYQAFRLGTGLRKVIVPANEVAHYFRKESPSQIRGTPLLAPVLDALYEMDDFIDATVGRQIAAQALAFVIKKASVGQLPTLGSIEAVDTPIGFNGQRGFKPVQRIDPKTVTYLNPDEQIEALQTPDVGDSFSKLLVAQLRSIAAACDITYEELTGDMTGVNYSSARVAIITIRRVTEQNQQLLLIPSVIHPIAMRFREFAGLRKQKFAKEIPRYEIPATAEIDPLKAVKAQNEKLRAGLTTLERELSADNLDFDTVVAQIAKEQNLNIVLSSNPSKDKAQAAETDVPPSATDEADA